LMCIEVSVLHQCLFLRHSVSEDVKFTFFSQLVIVCLWSVTSQWSVHLWLRWLLSSVILSLLVCWTTSLECLGCRQSYRVKWWIVGGSVGCSHAKLG